MTLVLAWFVLGLAGACVAAGVGHVVYLAWLGDEGARSVVIALGAVAFCAVLAWALLVVIK